MIFKLLIVGEGERDNAVVAPLTQRLLSTPIEHQFVRWPHLFGAGKGYAKKLRFAMLQVRRHGLQGLVGVVDSDSRHSGRHLPKLMKARTDARSTGDSTPVALGEAIPHLEAWLLDDPVAVRTALGFTSDVEIKSPTKINSPKEELQMLCSSCPMGQTAIEILAQVASLLSMERCNHAQQTGFEKFAAEVEQELRPLCKS
jgi:hypothetical protein